MLLSEIQEMPLRAKDFLAVAKPDMLPVGVPYIGMGSSYFAPLCFKYMGINIFPEIASEFYNYLAGQSKYADGVLLSQSGRSTEVLWCASLFEKFTAITNDIESPLAKFPAVSAVIPLLAGEEKGSSSKTYFNTLLALFLGFGLDVTSAVDKVAERENEYHEVGKSIADGIFRLYQEKKVTGLYVIGSGPNMGTAMQAALILSESTKLNFNGMATAQYDHGPKETADGSVVINIVANGKSFERSKQLSATIGKAGASVFNIYVGDINEKESILHTIIPLNYLAYYLSKNLAIQDTFVVGGKVTEVDL
ncbi:SIS domain-containing protein [Flavitalea antarctica]